MTRCTRQIEADSAGGAFFRDALTSEPIPLFADVGDVHAVDVRTLTEGMVLIDDNDNLMPPLQFDPVTTRFFLYFKGA